jgi:hypothetical protein
MEIPVPDGNLLGAHAVAVHATQKNDGMVGCRGGRQTTENRVQEQGGEG